MAQNNGPEPKRRGGGRPFQPGQSGNPGGRPKAVREVVELARAHTVAAITALADIVQDSGAPPAARVTAADKLLERGWGKAVQPVSGADGGAVVLRVVTGVPRSPDDDD